MRDAIATRLEPLDDALGAVTGPGNAPLVLADAADNAGGGAPSDSTFMLRRVLERGMRDVVIGCIWDPQAVAFCAEAGEGARFPLRFGGKCGPASGDPVDLEIEVRRVVDAHWQTGLSGGRSELGQSVWVAADGIDIVLITRRAQTFAPNAFTGLGIELARKAAVIVKSIQHFHAAFVPIAREVRYAGAPGALSFDFANLPYTRREGNYWPRVADPFGS